MRAVEDCGKFRWDGSFGMRIAEDWEISESDVTMAQWQCMDSLQAMDPSTAGENIHDTPMVVLSRP